VSAWHPRWLTAVVEGLTAVVEELTAVVEGLTAVVEGKCANFLWRVTRAVSLPKFDKPELDSLVKKKEKKKQEKFRVTPYHSRGW
jgi:hypothetical protein